MSSITYGYLGFRRGKQGFLICIDPTWKTSKIHFMPAFGRLELHTRGPKAATNVVPSARAHGVGAWAPEAAPHVHFLAFYSCFRSFFCL